MGLYENFSKSTKVGPLRFRVYAQRRVLHVWFPVPEQRIENFAIDHKRYPDEEELFEEAARCGTFFMAESTVHGLLAIFESAVDVPVPEGKSYIDFHLSCGSKGELWIDKLIFRKQRLLRRNSLMRMLLTLSRKSVQTVYTLRSGSPTGLHGKTGAENLLIVELTKRDIRDIVAYLRRIQPTIPVSS